MELELELKGQLPGLECSRGPNRESGVPSERSGGPSEGSEGQTEGSGSSNARGMEKWRLTNVLCGTVGCWHLPRPLPKRAKIGQIGAQI